MQVYHGTIICCDEHNTVAQYLVEHKGKIEFVGEHLPETYLKGKSIELGARAIIPAFGDGHIHYTNWALIATSYFDVRTARNLTEFGDIIRKFVQTHKIGDILGGFGASKHSVTEKRLITKTELDAVYNDKPMLIVCYDGHSLIANSKLIDLYPERVRKLRGFNADTGQLFNEAYYAGLDYATSLISSMTMVKSIAKAYDLLAQQGIVLMDSVESIGFPGDLDVTLAILIGKARSHKSYNQTRLYFQTMQVEKALKRKLPRIGGCFATALDGCFGACDAALTAPYSHDPTNRGILFYSDDQVIKFVKEANRAGLQIAMHTIGDAAVKQALKAYEIALQDYPREDHRHMLIHACLIGKEDIELCARLGIAVTYQPGFLISPLEPTEYLEKILGSRVRSSSPAKMMLEAGLHVSGGSDGPVTHPNAIEGIYGACNHPYDPSQSVSIQDALKMYTSEVAWMSFDEQERGSLTRGKIADFVILNRNPLEMNPKDLLQLQVKQLFLRGKPYKPGMSLAGLLWHALWSGRQPI